MSGEEHEDTRRLSERKKQRLVFPFFFVRRRLRFIFVVVVIEEEEEKVAPKDDRRDGEREKGNIYPLSSALAFSFSRERERHAGKKERRRCVNSHLVFAGAGRFDDAHFSWFRSHVFLCFLDVCKCSKLRKVASEVLWERFRAVH